jgi:hypothetical protein
MSVCPFWQAIMSGVSLLSSNTFTSAPAWKIIRNITTVLIINDTDLEFTSSFDLCYKCHWDRYLEEGWASSHLSTAVCRLAPSTRSQQHGWHSVSVCVGGGGFNNFVDPDWAKMLGIRIHKPASMYLSVWKKTDYLHSDQVLYTWIKICAVRTWLWPAATCSGVPPFASLQVKQYDDTM